MADFENIVVEGTAEQLRNVLDASAYTDKKMNQYGIQKAGYISLQSQESDSDDDIIDIFPSPSVKDENGYPKYGIVEFSTSQDRTPTILRGIHDAINPDDATPLKQVEELLKNGNNTNQEAVLYTPQSPTPEQQAQARKNIDAMQNGVADSDLDMTGHIIRNVGQASFICDEEGTDQDTGSNVSLLASVQQHENNENSYDLSFRGFNRKVSLPQKVRLSNIAGGTQDSDAATVGQVKEMVKQTGGGSLSAEIVDNVLVVTLTGGLKASIENGVLVVA